VPQSKTCQPETVSKVVQENIQGVLAGRKRLERRQTRSERLAASIAGVAGSMWFAYLHVVWFGVWIGWNVWRGDAAFDPYPFGALTTIVSLEAIFLTLFVLVSQNREARLEEQRADLDLQIDLLSERELTRILCIVAAIARSMDVDLCDIDTAGLEQETKVHDLLRALDQQGKDGRQ
jgi:uncharacterized membrane protein